MYKKEPSNDKIPENYIAVFNGGSGEMTYSTYIYKIDNKQANYGFKYINTTNTTKSWGSSEWEIKITDKGKFDWTDGAFIVAKENNAYQAMYELCMRHPNHRESANLCELAVSGGNGSALLNQGNKQYAEKNYIQALQSFTQALRSPLLTDEEKGQISEKIGILYLDKNSTYYNSKKGLPLIEKATQQRSALANNIIGVYSMLGLEGQKANLEKMDMLLKSFMLKMKNMKNF